MEPQSHTQSVGPRRMSRNIYIYFGGVCLGVAGRYQSIAPQRSMRVFELLVRVGRRSSRYLRSEQERGGWRFGNAACVVSKKRLLPPLGTLENFRGICVFLSPSYPFSSSCVQLLSANYYQIWRTKNFVIPVRGVRRMKWQVLENGEYSCFFYPASVLTDTQ